MDRSEWVLVPRVATPEMLAAVKPMPRALIDEREAQGVEGYRERMTAAVMADRMALAQQYETMLAAAPPPPAEQASGELAALRVQEWLQREYDVLPPVQEIERAMQTPCSCPYVEAALTPQQPEKGEG